MQSGPVWLSGTARGMVLNGSVRAVPYNRSNLKCY